MRVPLWSVVVLVGCGPTEMGGKSEVAPQRSTGLPDSGAPWVPPGCGDGVLDPGELCDDGAGNSDVAADACRTTCVPAACGDGVVDSDEACDDGNLVSADGCDATCVEETGLLEVEPNDRWDLAQPLAADRAVRAALPVDDLDCFSVEAPACGSLAASVTGDCPGPVAVALHGPDGVVTATGATTSSTCAGLDPTTADGARFLAEGTWAVCVSAPTRDPVSGYTLALELLSIDETDFELPDGQDPDADGVPDQCDDDDDGDLVPDDTDLCPDVPDGPDAPPFQVSAQGFIRSWLAAGPYTGTSSTDRCRPSDDTLVHATDDALAAPAVATSAGTEVWTTLLSTSDRIELLTDYGGVAAPREVYTAVWLRASAGPATLALGPDDGVRAWWDGVEVLDVAGCQGTNIDQFQADITFTGDWQLLLVKIRDQGGGWGNYARVLDAAGAPRTDLEVALTPDGAPLPATDTDGDGLGDACDPTPAG